MKILVAIVTALSFVHQSHASDALCSAVKTRRECGFSGITNTTCLKRGCCFDAKTPDEISCFFKDVDECSQGLADCDSNAECTDTMCGFTCVCKQGYTGSGQTCQDIDECSLGLHKCDPNAACTNTIGGYTCACNAGYAGSGQTCEEICPLKEANVYYVHSVCYKLFPEKESWDQANTKCQSVKTSAHLAELNTTQKLNDVTEIATKAGVTQFWTAAKRKPGTTDVYIWSNSGKTIPATFFNWADEEPDKRADEEFLFLDIVFQSTWAWHDTFERYHKASICEI